MHMNEKNVFVFANIMFLEVLSKIYVEYFLNRFIYRMK